MQWFGSGIGLQTQREDGPFIVDREFACSSIFGIVCLTRPLSRRLEVLEVYTWSGNVTRKQDHRKKDRKYLQKMRHEYNKLYKKLHKEYHPMMFGVLQSYDATNFPSYWTSL